MSLTLLGVGGTGGTAATVAPNVVSSLARLFSPAVSVNALINGGFQASTAGLFSPDVTSAFVQSIQVSTAVANSVSVQSGVTLTPAVISSTAALFSPLINGTPESVNSPNIGSSEIGKDQIG